MLIVTNWGFITIIDENNCEQHSYFNMLWLFLRFYLTKLSSNIFYRSGYNKESKYIIEISKWLGEGEKVETPQRHSNTTSIWTTFQNLNNREKKNKYYAKMLTEIYHTSMVLFWLEDNLHTEIQLQKLKCSGNKK